MATIKSFTDIEQSRKLAEILPLESADMVLLHEEPYETSDSKFDGLHQALCVPFSKYDKSWRQKYKNISYFPCWSLGVLLDVLPNNENISTNLSKGGYRISTLEYTNSWFVDYEDETDGQNNCVTSADNPVDVCVDMIVKLNELKML